jgi:hypothetical protein
LALNNIETLNYLQISRILDVVTEIFHDAIQTKYIDAIGHLKICYDRKSPERNQDTGCVYAFFLF